MFFMLFYNSGTFLPDCDIGFMSSPLMGHNSVRYQFLIECSFKINAEW